MVTGGIFKVNKSSKVFPTSIGVGQDYTTTTAEEPSQPTRNAMQWMHITFGIQATE